MQGQTYIAFLRGINVGGHHKVPMAELRKEMEGMGFENIITLLNSGNVIFEGASEEESQLEQRIADQLEKTFGFPIPVLLRTADEIQSLFKLDPFKDIELTKDLRFYVSFLKKLPEVNLSIPWQSEERSYKILQLKGRSIISVLDLSVTKTPKAMEALERMYGKNITTRNWKTILRIIKKLDS